MDEVLTYSCPHCQHQFSDEWELITADTLQTFDCEKCHNPFTLLLKECLVCVEETIFTEKPPAEIHVSELKCHACGTPFQSDYIEEQI